MQTVNDSIDLPGVLARVDHLKSGISNVASRELGLIKTKAERFQVLRRETAGREDEVREKLNRRLQTLEADRQRALESARLRWETRSGAIHQAFHSSKSAMANQAQGMKDRRIGMIQGTIMKNRQTRQEELERAGSEHEAFLRLLGSDRKERLALRKSLLSALRSYRWMVARELAKAKEEEVKEADPEQSRAAMLEKLAEAKQAVDGARRLPLASLFHYIPLSLLMAAVAGFFLWQGFRAGGKGMESVWIPLAASLGGMLALWVVGWFTATSQVRRAAGALAAARAFEKSAMRVSTSRMAGLEGEIREEKEQEGKNLSETFRESDSEWKTRLAAGQRKLEAKMARVPQRLQRLYDRRLAAIEAGFQKLVKTAHQEAEQRLAVVGDQRDQAQRKLDREMDLSVESLTEPWKNEVLPSYSALVELDKRSRNEFPEWTAERCDQWIPPTAAPRAVRLGSLEVIPQILTGSLPADQRFEVPGSDRFLVPFSQGFPATGSLMIENEPEYGEPARKVLAGCALRLVASFPPGRSSFVFIDPVGLGKDFAGLMHLADYEESLITHRIWTQQGQIEERLAELNEHIEKVIQMYLRNEYKTIADYNEQAGSVAEKYRFLVIAGFPTGFSETATSRLRSIASSGARCGVFLLIQRDLGVPAPDAMIEDELRRACVRIRADADGFHLLQAPEGARNLRFDPPPTDEDATALVHRIGKASIDSNRVQVPFSQIAPPPGEEWQLVVADELRVPVGRTGAKKLQMLAIGKGTRQHMLVAGKTGSGKSTLFHVIICNLALWCSPDQVEFYLVDFKKGVEFKCYASKRLPHARVVAVESDREFALSVLQRVDAELRRRGELFRQEGVQDLAGYHRPGTRGPLPRTLLLIDEFQEFFTEDDPVAQEASLLLDRIVRQGRAFGIHVILGSQTLGGAYTLARATLGQMVIRVALQCNEADSHLIMDDDNPAPRMLNRPGEGIYNDQAGTFAANSPFQIVWLPEEERDVLLDKVRARAEKEISPTPVPLVFEGNAPSEVAENEALAVWLKSPPSQRPAAGKAWLGSPNSIKGPSEVTFARQSGTNLLVIGQSAARLESMLGIALISLAVQYPAGAAEFVVLDGYADDPSAHGLFQKLQGRFPHRIRMGGPSQVAALMGELSQQLAARNEAVDHGAPEVFVIIRELQRFKTLRPDDDYRFSSDDGPEAASATFANLVNEGGPLGVHVMAGIDTWNNVSRWIPRKLLAEFGQRVLFQMSAGDSSNLMDSQAASALGLHRAILHQEHFGTQETFRPYAMPEDAWLEGIAGTDPI